MSEKGSQLSFKDQFAKKSESNEPKENDQKIKATKDEVKIPGDPFSRECPRYKDTYKYKGARYG